VLESGQLGGLGMDVYENEVSSLADVEFSVIMLVDGQFRDLVSGAMWYVVQMLPPGHS
jgi:lactate dehydrogenase-like 2-hydroxyacid dehydrogenase